MLQNLEEEQKCNKMRPKPTYANFSESQSNCEKLKTAVVSKFGRHHNNVFS